MFLFICYVGIFTCLSSHPLIDHEKVTWPQEILVAQSKQIYVLDSGLQVVWVFDTEGSFLAELGGKGSGPGSFQQVTSMAILNDQRLLVLDNGQKFLNFFSPDGTFQHRIRVPLGSFGHLLPISKEQLLITSSNGSIFSYRFGKDKTKKYRFHIIDYSGKIVRSFGEFTPNENPLLESQLNNGSVVSHGGTVFYAGRVQNEWSRYSETGHLKGVYKPGFPGKKPKAEMVKAKGEDGNINLNMKLDIDVYCLDLELFTDNTFLMLRATASQDDSGIPARLVSVDFDGNVMRVFEDTYYSHTFAVFSERASVLIPTLDDRDRWLISLVEISK